MNTQRTIDFVLKALLVGGLITVGGCGKGEYERRVSEGVKSMRISGSLGGPVLIPGTPLQIRLPLAIDANAKAYNESSPEPTGQGQVKPQRLNPPFFKIPGLRVCYEVQAKNPTNGAQLPVFWYIGALAPQDPLPDGKSIDQYAMDTITAAFAQEKKVPLADGLDAGTAGTTAWKRVTMTVSQPFIGLDGVDRTEGGSFQMLVGEVDGWRVIVAYRGPGAILTQMNAAEIATLVAGSVSMPPAAADPAAQAPAGQAPAGQAPAGQAAPAQ